MTARPVLADCPFCGSGIDNAGPHAFPSAFYDSGRKVREWTARCGNPDCAAELVGPTEAETAARWNRRTPPGV